MRENLRYLLELLGDFLSIGIAVVGSILAGAFTGWLIDEKVFKGRTYPWLTTIGIILGAIGGFKNIFYLSKKRLREQERREREKEKE